MLHSAPGLDSPVTILPPGLPACCLSVATAFTNRVPRLAQADTPALWDRHVPQIVPCSALPCCRTSRAHAHELARTLPANHMPCHAVPEESDSGATSAADGPKQASMRRRYRPPRRILNAEGGLGSLALPADGIRILPLHMPKDRMPRMRQRSEGGMPRSIVTLLTSIGTFLCPSERPSPQSLILGPYSTLGGIAST